MLVLIKKDTPRTTNYYLAQHSLIMLVPIKIDPEQPIIISPTRV